MSKAIIVSLFTTMLFVLFGMIVSDLDPEEGTTTRNESAVQIRSDSPPVTGEFAAERVAGPVIKLPAGVSATMKFSKLTDEYNSVIVIETKNYEGPSLVNIPIRDQHGNFLGSIQLEATKP